MPTPEHTQKKKTLGLCRDCREPALPGYIQCAKHRKIQRTAEIKYDIKNRKKLREQIDCNCGLCPYKITIEWLKLPKKDRDYALDFLKYLLDKQNGL